MLNKLILKGRLVKAPELRRKEKDGKIILWAYYRLAVNRKGAETDFINCVAFGREAEFIKKYAKKGTTVLVSGRLRTGEYKDKDGVRLPMIQLIVTEQGLCVNWNGDTELAPEREFTPSQDYPCLDELDEETINHLLEYGPRL